MIQSILIFIVAIEHLFIMLLEMFFIQSDLAKKAFNMETKILQIKEVQVLFANQGLYNGFLAAGLFWSLFSPSELKLPLQFFFLGCVILAAIYGSFTSSKKIIIKQGGPAILALIVLIAGILF